MADLGFGIQTFTAFGIEGEFTIGAGERKTAAKYLLTKIRPGTDGTWENVLARKMRPWREVFSVGRVTFDELLQRDLDDSRVAMDLIPYLLGSGRNAARFFPPILSIAVPLRPNKTGIEDFYPDRLPDVPEPAARYGHLFRVDPFVSEGNRLPMARFTCNESKLGFVIADGQHRAMAVLAINRILTGTWDRDPYASYYQHLTICEDQVKEIELPVCIVYFPDLTQANSHLRDSGLTLTKVCRDLFLTVNKQAKAVSRSRQLLLDDEDLAARMMRKTLSKMKDRTENEMANARIYSFAFGDADSYLSAQDVSGRLEYSSAMLLHRAHAAICFTNSGNLLLESDRDLTDARSLRSTSRAVELLRGTRFEGFDAIGRNSGRVYPEADVVEIADLLSFVSDTALLALFDEFSPFTAHNAQMLAAKINLNSDSMRSDPVQAKCSSLMFEGSGARGIFDMHVGRVNDAIKEASDRGDSPTSYLQNQEADVKAVQRGLEVWEGRIRRGRALRLLRIRPDASDEDCRAAETITKSIFSATSTQAFQLGFLTGIHGIVRLLTANDSTDYESQISAIKAIAKAWLAGLNRYFDADDGQGVVHVQVTQAMREFKGFKVFDPSEPGLRALLGMSVRELNESQYTFFRYACLEIVHSPKSLRAAIDALRSVNAELAASYCERLSTIAERIVAERKSYIDKGLRSALNSNEAKVELATLVGGAELRGETIEECQRKFEEITKAAVDAKAAQYLRAAVGENLLDSAQLAQSYEAALR